MTIRDKEHDVNEQDNFQKKKKKKKKKEKNETSIPDAPMNK